jgi:hypothetical protein
MPNDTTQQPGRRERRHATESQNAGPVNCIRSLGDGSYLESTPDPFSISRGSHFEFLVAHGGIVRHNFYC